MLKKIWNRFWRGADGNFPPIAKILNVVIVLLVLLLIACIAGTIENVSYYMDEGYSEESFVYRMQDESYGRMVEGYYQNLFSNKSDSDRMKEYYAVAQYAEAAAYYNAFSETGDEKRAKRYAEKMEAAETSMGSLYSERDVIKRKLGLDK